MKPKEIWNGELCYEFIIEGCSDYVNLTDPHRRKGVCGHVKEWNVLKVLIKSGQIEAVVLSVTEDKRSAVLLCAQYILYVMRIFELMKLMVKNHINAHVYNKLAVDLANNWSVGGSARHCEIKDHL